jgi:hypothetical protein
MKVELTFPDEFADLIAEKVVEKIKHLLEARPSDPRPTPLHHKEIDPMRAINDHEVALLVGKSVQSLRNDRYLGKGVPYFKVGRAVRYRGGDVLKWLEAQRVEPRR